jgi:hypothetical protein
MTNEIEAKNASTPNDCDVGIKDVVTGCVGEDLVELAQSLGYAWPNDDEGKWRVLKTMATRARYWRERVNETDHANYEAVSRERLYQHQQDRYLATLRKLTNTRKALRQYMASQAAFVREGIAEIVSASR